MPELSIQLTNYLIKRYDLNISDITNIIEDEWDFIEQEHVERNHSIELIAKELVEIYMVA